jgi:hypothetical protein
MKIKNFSKNKVIQLKILEKGDNIRHGHVKAF